MTGSRRRHLPLGAPDIDYQGGSTCLLTQRHYISGYSQTLMMPLWTAYELKNEVR